MPLTFSFKIFHLPLKHPFTISRYTVSIQKTVIVSISDGQFTGCGEATVNPYYNSTIEKLTASLDRLKPLIESAASIHPEEMWNRCEPLVSDDYFALCAVDIAFWDLYARKNEKTLRSYFSDIESAPQTSYTIGLDSLEIMKRKIIETPWPIYKIKLGTANDLGILTELRKITGSLFRVDANAAWNVGEAISLSNSLKAMNVEFIEQPLHASDVSGMRDFMHSSPIPLIADESCQRIEDVEKCFGLFHGVNIKLMKCGGITPALKMIQIARQHGLLVMAGCMTESTVGISALVQIAPLLDFLDADGAMLLAKDTATGVSFADGRILYAAGSGTGVELLP